MKNKKIIILVIVSLVLFISGILLNTSINNNNKPNNKLDPTPNVTPKPLDDEVDEWVVGTYECTTLEKKFPVNETNTKQFSQTTLYSFVYDENKVVNGKLTYFFQFDDQESFNNHKSQVVDTNYNVTVFDDALSLTKTVSQSVILNGNLGSEGSFNLDTYMQELQNQGFTCQRVNITE